MKERNSTKAFEYFWAADIEIDSKGYLKFE
jgi:hypothetical protein